MTDHPGIKTMYQTEDGEIWYTMGLAKQHDLDLQMGLQVSRVANEFMSLWENVEIKKLSQVLPTVEDLFIEWLNTTNKVKLC